MIFLGEGKIVLHTISNIREQISPIRFTLQSFHISSFKFILILFIIYIMLYINLN